jgi:hypothetical protein
MLKLSIPFAITLYNVFGQNEKTFNVKAGDGGAYGNDCVLKD